MNKLLEKIQWIKLKEFNQVIFIEESKLKITTLQFYHNKLKEIFIKKRIKKK